MFGHYLEIRERGEYEHQDGGQEEEGADNDQHLHHIAALIAEDSDRYSLLQLWKSRVPQIVSK